MAAMFIVELEIQSPMVGTGFLWGAWVFSFGPPFMSHLLLFHYVGSLSSGAKVKKSPTLFLGKFVNHIVFYLTLMI